MNPSQTVRRQALCVLLTTAFAAVAVPAGAQEHAVTAAALSAVNVEVWKDPACGCCNDWIAHLQQHGATVQAHDIDNRAAMRSRLGMPAKYGSCHTAVVQGYVIEGHVPAADIQRLLHEKPAALGLAAPGMPIGSPGMDGAVYGGRQDPYDTLLVDKAGDSTVFQSHP